jgi:hypothetical protein
MEIAQNPDGVVESFTGDVAHGHRLYQAFWQKPNHKHHQAINRVHFFPFHPSEIK